MKNQITVQSASIAEMKKNVRCYVHQLLKSYAQILSSIIEEPISVKNALRITHVQVALIAMLISANINTVLLLICLVWFIVTLLDCKRGGLK